MAQSKVSLSMARISKLLPEGQGKAIIGSGCIVSLKPTSGASSPFLITTTQVINRNDLLSSVPSIEVEFLDKSNGKLRTINLSLNSDILDSLPGRVLEGTGDALKDVSFLVIPVQNHEGNNAFIRWFQRMLSSLRGTSFEKRYLACNHPNDETLQTAISRREIFCHVMWDNKTDAFTTEPYCLEFAGTESREFALTPPRHNDRDDYANQQLKDFRREEKPKGAPILNAKGEFVGMLAFTASEQRRLFPLFLPTLDMWALRSFTKDDWNSQVSDHAVATLEIKVETEASMTASCGSDQDVGKVTGENKVENDSASSSNNQNHKHGLGYPEIACANSVVQGSGASALGCRSSDHFAPGGNGVLPIQKSPLSAVAEHSNLNEPVSGEEENASPSQSSHETANDEESLTSLEHAQDVTTGKEAGMNSSLEPVEDEQHSEQNDSRSQLSENNNVQQPVRPAMLSQNSCHDDKDDGLNDEEGYHPAHGVDETGSPKPFQTPTLSERFTALPPLEHRVNDDSSGVSTQVVPSTTQDSIASAKLVRVKPDSFVKDVIVSKAKVMDMLSLYLDRSVQPGLRDVRLVQRWENLADEFGVPPERKAQCEHFHKSLSPSERMFEYLRITNDSLLIKTIKDHLLVLGRNDVVAEFDINSGLSEEKATVTDLCDRYSDTLNAVCLKLDSARGTVTWKDLGFKLGLQHRVLRAFQDPNPDHSPSQTVLEIIESRHPDLSITELKAIALEELNVPAVATELGKLPDGSTIKTLLDERDILDTVTAILDLQDTSWTRLGLRFEISRRELNTLKPEKFSSPTKLMMEIIIQNDPDLKMKRFLDALVKIKRQDLINELKQHFHFTWM